jgi:hypothetical protein
VIAPADVREADLQRALSQAAVQISRIAVVEPSLEDVFLALLGT